VCVFVCVCVLVQVLVFNYRNQLVCRASSMLKDTLDAIIYDDIFIPLITNWGDLGPVGYSLVLKVCVCPCVACVVGVCTHMYEYGCVSGHFDSANSY